MAGQSGGLIGTQIAISTQAAETTTINSSADITFNAATNIATVLIIAGSNQYRGASLLALQGAIASGAGSIQAVLPKSISNTSIRISLEFQY